MTTMFKVTNVTATYEQRAEEDWADAAIMSSSQSTVGQQRLWSTESQVCSKCTTLRDSSSAPPVPSELTMIRPILQIKTRKLGQSPWISQLKHNGDQT